MLDLQQVKTFGINPEEYDLVTLKSQQYFHAAFDPIAGKVIICESGALCSVSYKKKNFPNVTVPTFPL
jgi:microcystin degradation protein MlrC